MEKRTFINEKKVNYFRNTEAANTSNGEVMTVTVVSPEITASLEHIRNRKKSLKEQKEAARAAVRDNLAGKMKDLAIWHFENRLSVSCAWVSFIDCRGMGCRLMRGEGVRFTSVRRRHEVGFYGETPFDVVTLKCRLTDLKKFSVAMRKLRRLAIEGGFEGYPELCAAVINKDN